MLMRQWITLAASITLWLMNTAMSSSRSEMGQPMRPAELRQAAEEAYIYGYPLVLMHFTRQVMTTASDRQSGRAPLNQFGHKRTFPDYTFTDIVSPNADTLYSQSWLDLSSEPQVLSLPPAADRYYLMQIVDAWTNVFASIGTRTTGRAPGNYAIVGPFWQGKLPAEMAILRSPTNMAWIIGRTQTNGASDYTAVHVLQDQYKLTPLSRWQSNDMLQDVNADADIKQTPPNTQVVQMEAIAFFRQLSLLLKDNPPAPGDTHMLQQLAQLGIIRGEEFNPKSLPKDVLEALNSGAKTGLAKIITEGRNPRAAVHKNGWQIIYDLGIYGTRYLARAATAYYGLGANIAKDAVYPMARVDETHQPFDGKHRYVLHFDKNNLPPVHAFWSVTIYNNQQFFVKNPINRYAIGDRDSLQLNSDGSLDIYIQHASPGTDREANWLPAPQAPFNLVMRLYWPSKEILNHTWFPPGVKRVDY